MSVVQWTDHNGKVVSNISLTQPFPGGKIEYSVSILFDDGSSIVLKSQSNIMIEEGIINDKYTNQVFDTTLLTEYDRSVGPVRSWDEDDSHDY